MESKEALPLPHHNHPTSPPPSTTNLRRFLRYTASALILYTTFIIIGLLNPSSSIPFFSSCAKWNSAVAPPHRKVALEAHIMSKCPDAQDCLRDLILPTMQQVSDQVDFTLSYIGQITPSTGVECKHGPSECLGNIVELCAASLYPDPKLYLGFTMCLTADLTHIPDRELIHACALEHGLSFEKLNDCASADEGAWGMDLLRQSVARSEAANVTYSCTIRLDEKIRCIRDGGVWKDCEGGSTPQDLISDIMDAYVGTLD